LRISYHVLAFVVALSGLVETARGAYPISIPTPPGKPGPVYQRYQLAARDGIKLTVHEWAPPRRPVGKPVVLFIHGIGMHGEPYGSIAAGFTVNGIALFAPDLRGHGQSEGARGILAEPHVLRADLGAVFELIEKRHPGAPVVLIGDSMGGLLAADYAWRGERRLAGLALLVPAFGVHGGLLENHLSELGSVLTKGRVPVGSPDQIQACTRNPAFARARLADPLALAEVRVSYLMTIARMEQDWPKAAAEIRVPLIIVVAGKDHIVDNKATKKVFERAATPPPTKTWRRLEDAYHTVCWDPETPALVDQLGCFALQAAPERGASTSERGASAP